MFLEEKNLISLLENFKCFENQPRIAVGVSGGPDSMALAYLLSKWIKKNKGKLYCVIFDHNIRSNSKYEAYQVKDMLKNLKIKASIIKPNKNKLIKKNMENARLNRFTGLLNFCKKKNILHLFLGHHFDDNLETYLIRKINGSNLEGLDSMNHISFLNNIQILRPFLKIKKSSIISYNKKNKIKFINDPSNLDINYTRVKVRNFLRNKTYKRQVQNDFLEIKIQIPHYKKMIWELFIRSLVGIKKNQIIVNFKKLVKNDNLIIEKHILLILKYLLLAKKQTKSSKINQFIAIIKKPNFKIYNLSGIIIKKNSDFLIFSQK